MCTGVEKLRQVIEEVVRRVTPQPEEYEQVQRIVEEVTEALEDEVLRRGVTAKVTVQGSIAKDTWLSGDRDIDLFLIYPRTYSVEEAVRTTLDLTKSVARERGWSWVEKYAEHPYLRLLVQGFEVDVVPCMEMRLGEKPLTPADRTPLHTEYVRTHLRPELRGHVRALKRLLKTVGIYGAEIKVRGFSGYLCELLTIAYDGLDKLLQVASTEWRPYRTYVDLEHHYSSEKELRKYFGDAVLVVVDPVDKTRNAAAAVSLQSFCNFIAVAKVLVEYPEVDLFFPREVRGYSIEEALQQGRHIVALEIELPRLPPDTIWGQLERSVKGILKLLEQYDFTPLQAEVWSDEERTGVILVELVSIELPLLEKHYGPPVYSREALNFLRKWVREGVVGPYIEGTRWVVYRVRRYRHVRRLLEEKLLTTSLGKYVAQSIREKRYRIYVDREVEELCDKYPELRRVVQNFLRRYLPWLRPLEQVQSPS